MFGRQRTSSKGALLGEVYKGLGNIGIIKDEVIVEVDKAQERPHILDLCGSWPVGNPICLMGSMVS